MILAILIAVLFLGLVVLISSKTVRHSIGRALLFDEWGGFFASA